MAVKKPKLFTMKVNELEKKRWQQIAKSRGVSLAELIRRYLDGLPIPQKKRQSKPVIKVDTDLLFQLSGIGNNLNQISRRVNQGDRFDVVMALHLIEILLERLLHAHEVP